MAKSTRTGSSGESGSETLDDDMDLLDTDLAEGEEWDDSLDDEALAPVKKKGKMFNLVIILIGVLIFGGIVYSKLATAPQPNVQSPVAVTDSVPMPEPSPVLSPVATPTGTPSPDTGPLTPMPDFGEATEAPSSTSEGGSAPISISGVNIVPPVVTLTPNDPIVPALNVDAKEGTAVPLTAPSVPVSDISGLSEKMAATVDSSPLITEHVKPANSDSSTVLPVSTTVPASVRKEIPATSSLEDVKNETEGQIKESVSIKTDDETSADARKMALLEDQVKLLSDRLATLEQKAQQPSASPLVDRAPEDTASSDMIEKVDPIKDAPVDRPVSKIEKFRSRAAPKIHYVLRGVSGNTAYVARSQTSPVIRVQVGDTLDGMGTVKNIQMKTSGHWAVITTDGTISSR